MAKRVGPLRIDDGEWCIIWDGLRYLLENLEKDRRAGVWDSCFALYYQIVYILRQRIGEEGILAYRRGTMAEGRLRQLKPQALSPDGRPVALAQDEIAERALEMLCHN